MTTTSSTDNNSSASGNTGGSHFLNPDLSELVVAEALLTFLDRSSVANLMKVSPLRERLLLSKYYCCEHGTKLEAEWESESESEEDSAGESNVDKPMQCEDCLEARFGLRRCPKCDDFDESFETCQGCQIKDCFVCRDRGEGVCIVCGTYYCGAGKKCQILCQCASYEAFLWR